ncbi:MULTISPECIES: DUF4178 domain-containing protein [unclassified Micromonospora]|uniref:DUF4178 domain-containing protein n=1 Tax=unclassified Micromonospora TaxID=2617518 RepID=UPI001591A9EF|nr:DUF4178 domain-containing protein [Verrucosispora sp. NA02020]QKW11447.1 DUF4178 domain-containing protein [Verrucosispora sp. NA02020]
MDDVTAYLVIALGCLLAGLAVVVLVARRRGRPTTAPGRRVAAGPSTDPRRIEVGDIVEIGDLSYRVRGSIRLVEGEWSWAEHLLDDDSGRPRLSVAESPEFALVLWEPQPGRVRTVGVPAVDVAGRRYDWHESGQARYTATGLTGLPPTGTMRYHDYRAPGGARLTFEAYGEAGWEVALGRRLDEGDVTVHPQGRGS